MSAQPMTDIQSGFLDAMRHVPATVNVLTTDGPGGRFGVTVTAMCSLSLGGEAPSLLVCVNGLSRACAAIRDNGVLCVNALQEDQQDVADLLAGRGNVPHEQRFLSHAWTAMETGSPVLVDALASFDCRAHVLQTHDSHVIFVGEVVALKYRGDCGPLIYANRRYHTLPVARAA